MFLTQGYHLNMTRLRKNQFLQVRVSSRQKAALRRLARRAGVDVSRYVLDRVLPGSALGLQLLLNRLARTWEPQPVLAEIADVLVALPPAEIRLGGANASRGGP
jgi:hypothetical protein